MARYGRDSFPPGFQWDPQKYDVNLRKWRVRFEIAALVFDDPLADEREDLRFPYDEERFIIVGEAAGQPLHVAFAVRGVDDEIIHIISARRLLPAERRAYGRARS